jgi:fatty acid desaturase
LALDPEIASAPALLDGWPKNPFTYLFLVSGQFLLVGKLGFTIACALVPKSIWSPLFPFIRPDKRRRVAWESRLALLVLGTILGIGFRLVPEFWMLLLAWPLAHLFLGFYLMAEHTGLPHDGDQIQRTRTVNSNALLRGLMWNMPYHAEHHAYPGVPYHALPALHRHLEPALRHTSSGYVAFHLDAAARAIRLRRPDGPP